MILRARWLLSPGDAALENAAIVIDAGRIARVAPWSDLAAPAGEPVTDLGDAVLIPGLVNAHTHLELSDLRGAIPPPRQFTDWLARIAKVVRGWSPETVAAAVRQGLAESMTAGVTTLGNISFAGVGLDALADAPVCSTNFVEVYGHTPGQVAGRLPKALAAAEGLRTGNRCRVGLSPHAPYTAGVRAYMAAAREAEARGWPLSTHLHETHGEIDLYRTRSGEFTRSLLLRALLAVSRFRSTGRSPIQTLAEAGFFARPILVAHGNYLEDADIDVLRTSRSTVAWCPRSHAYFGHSDHPYRRLLAAGVPVAMGTDSLASSPSLSILDEVRFVHEHDPDLPAETLLGMATAAGADFLAPGRTGRLRAGRDADVVALALPSPDTSPWEAFLAAETPPLAVFAAGTQIVVE